MAKIQFLVGFIVWIALLLPTILAVGSPRELFILNLEDGFFGCQVNESTEFLQIFELAKLCDGVPHCFRGSDELDAELKCTRNCSPRCVNGVCLDKQCHCNDGFGGKGCEMPDENECKYRPCDVFARCTNTLGSFYCTCFPGYEGNGFECKDINECENPALAAKCVRNAECCNLPAHYVCKCKPGFEGDGYTECRDVDECLQSNICAKGALCTNLEGNFTCKCPAGYTGDPYVEIYDIDECATTDICGVGASCTNTIGSYFCECMFGFEGDPVNGCVDIDECQRGINPCGQHGICRNTLGSYECFCPPGYVKTQHNGCEDIDECLNIPCGAGTDCQNLPGSFQCLCLPGYEGNAKVACSRVAVEVRCTSNQECAANAECFDEMCRCVEGYRPSKMDCVDVDECTKPNICGPHAQCINIPSLYQCECNSGYSGKPPEQPCKAPCENIDCGPHAKCRPDGQSALCICDEGYTFDPRNVSAMCLDINECDTVGLGVSGLCGENAACTNAPGSFSCKCPVGYRGDPFRRCDDIDECESKNPCGNDALCRNTIGSYICECPSDKSGDPYIECEGPKLMTCDITNNNTCPGNSFCSPMIHVCVCPNPNVGDDCRHPCDAVFCGANTECMLINEKPMCVCKHGFTGSSVDPTGCIDINECTTGSGSPCGKNAVCKNTAGSHICECPAGFEGNPHQGCISSKDKIAEDCSKASICKSNEECVLEGRRHVCICKRGFIRDVKTGTCQDINECTEVSGNPVCGLNAICHNLIGSYECTCSPLYTGNPYMQCVKIDITCVRDDDCPGNIICIHGAPDGQYCGCKLPSIRQGKYCVSINYNCSTTQLCPQNLECALLSNGHGYCVCPRGYAMDDKGGCIDIDECSELKQRALCGYNADCVNTPGSYECGCRSGFSGDPTKECTILVKKCSSRKECAPNEVCGAPGECQCLPPFIKDGAECKHPCEFISCGAYAECILTNQGGRCQCVRGFDGNPQIECFDINECSSSDRKACGPNAICINSFGNYSCECPSGMEGNPFAIAGCKKTHDLSGCTSNKECPLHTICHNKECVDACSTIRCDPHATCVQLQSGAECQCNLGYQANAKSQCISKCESTLCAINAQCIIDNHGSPTCQCLAGYNGLPHAGGECRQEQCSRNEDCDKLQECLQGQCKERCQGVVCGMGARCDRAANRCECWPLFIGNPELLCVPPIMPPVCVPNCGRNAYCEYGMPNRCVCRPGLTGNPYDFCEAAPRRCDEVRCGGNANCVQGNSRVDCVCPIGFEGSPYLGCKDLNECLYGNICGLNAICINTLGSYECRCKAGFFGDPYGNCIAEQGSVTPSPGANEDDCTVAHVGCLCKITADCNSRELFCHPQQFVCIINPCRDQLCGPNAFCELQGENPICKCLPNFPLGDPNDVKVGCKGDFCENDLSCKQSEVCLRNNFGYRECIAVCKITQCGPNAFCQASNHRGGCACNAGFTSGDPFDLNNGCSTLSPNECEQDSSCPDNKVCVQVAAGNLACADPCESDLIACGPGARCSAENKRATCSCLDSYYGDPNDPIKGCIPKPPSECEKDQDCLQIEHHCQVDHIGVKKCISPCLEFNCEPKHAECIVVNRRAECQCKPGFTGRSNSREGCKPINYDECTSNKDCTPDKLCQRDRDGIIKCLEVCKLYSCGTNAVCVPKNHAHTCQCPPGLYIPDPNFSSSCIRVDCLSNNDCLENKVCSSGKCLDPCAKACGSNAVCLTQEHQAFCSCKAGFTGDPKIECKSIDFCDSNSCHPSAQCKSTPGSYVCSCLQGLIGNPYTEKCHPPGMCPNGDSDCEPTDKCRVDATGLAKCINPCDGYCGPNANCVTQNHLPSCSCKPNFVAMPTPRIGCSRKHIGCAADQECGQAHLCVEGECQYVCSVHSDCAQGEKCFNSICIVFCADSSQCSFGQVCSQGICVLGCRENKECRSPSESCIDNKCRNPCSVPGICGNNALCNVVNHQVQCSCPPTFAPNPTPVQGCIRMFRVCGNDAPCSEGFVCDNGECRQICQAENKCGFGERCASDRCEVTCTGDVSCQPGQVCVDQFCQAGCRTDGDCRSNEHCLKNQCFCRQGFVLTVTGCQDEDECKQNPCHPSSKCTNTPGSYICQCGAGEFGDPYSKAGCRADACLIDGDCPSTAVCAKDSSGKMNCIDPCVGVVCSIHAVCVVLDHQPYCECPQGFLGDPIDPEIGCYMPECVDHGKCSDDKECYQYKCENPCDGIDCGENGICVAKNHRGFCKCNEGYIPSDKGYCIDHDECKRQPHPCPKPAKCINFPGGYSCQCPAGFHEEYANQQINCQRNGDCPLGDVDCPVSLTCINASGISKCIDPCEQNACGKNALCRVVERRAVCYCPARFTGDPGTECFGVECLNSQECETSKACLGYACIDPCEEAGSCGINAECRVANHKAICRCKDGHEGNPQIGCKVRIPCQTDGACSLGETCQNKFCRVPCSTNRACYLNEQCINRKCTAVCSGDNECPIDRFCDKNVCKPRVKCRGDTDCNDGLLCLPNARNQPDCLNPCEGVICDGRNSECVVRDRLGICVCKQGFAGKPDDALLGCVKSECESNNQCSPDKTCIDYKCRNPCLQSEVQCGINAICIVTNHSPICKCRDGYEGDPLAGCSAIDFCRQSNPCGERATCQNTPGSFECVCLAGTVLDSRTGQCLGPNDCVRGDSDCSDNTRCMTDGSTVPTCRDPCLDVSCGYNAICLVERHRPMCRCNLGFDGNPLNGCQRATVTCSSNGDCSPGLVCENRVCKAACKIDRDCAYQERCSANRCGIECHRDDECPDNEICLSNTCQFACRSDPDCGSQESCISGHCRNLCEGSTACGINAECQMVDHQKVCSCPSGFTGVPDVECRRIPRACRGAEDCPAGQVCNGDRCYSQCTSDNDCVLSEKCIENQCFRTCKKDDNCFTGEICNRGICFAGCRNNDHCPSTLACIEYQCRDLCEGKASCGPNANCEMINHRPSCKCPATFVSYPTPNSGCIRDHPNCQNGNNCPSGYACMDARCIPICSSNSDCGDNEKCMEGRCLIACRRDNNCPEGEICDGHYCIPGCRSDDECVSKDSCISNKCRDPCATPTVCGTNGQCKVDNHQVLCLCPSGMTGNPNIACMRIVQTCLKNQDCGEGFVCNYGSCIGQCKNDAQCLNNERCISNLCIPVCTNDRNCPRGYACLNGLCQDPCANPSVCGVNAQCKVMNRQIACTCPAGMTGNPRVQCVRVPQRCTVINDCPSGLICHDQYCMPRCSGDNDCFPGESCRDRICRVSCSSFCPPGHICLGGACIAGCSDNDDCPRNRKCVQNQCQNPCSLKPSPCGINAECKVDNHNAMCMCPNGYAGEPTKRCDKVGCVSNAECDPSKACVNHVCQVPCLIPGACGRNAQCRVDNHRQICSCPLDFTGDPLKECFQVHRCDVSELCPGNLICMPAKQCGCPQQLRRTEDACIGSHNQSCSLSHACPVNQKCRLDLGICICPRGFMFNSAGECADLDECVQRPCGLNAHCSNTLGSFTCTCSPGHFGDPYSTYGCANISADATLCQKDQDCQNHEICVNGQCMQHAFCEDGVTCTASECSCDPDCPLHQACLRGRCVDPCRVGFACGQGSLCVSENHQAFCACPTGFYGDPRVRCVQASCRKDKDCPEDAICDKGFCINPCFANNPCDSNSICRMENHRPVCTCPPGVDDTNCYAPSTDYPPVTPVLPVTTKPVCSLDSDCPFSKACLQDTCRDPCEWFKPCGENAECRVNTHRAVCSCLPGFEGNPQTFCYKVSTPSPVCRGDAECPHNQACINNDCRNPCEYQNPCGQNARCTCVAHKVVCTCSAGYTGNPLSNCQSVITPAAPVCLRDSDCSYDKSCINEDCRNPCEWYKPCAQYAQCKVDSHRAICTCLVGYQGNPLVSCQRVTSPAPICLRDSDCSYDKACINEDCRNPCEWYKPCTQYAECKVNSHRAVCTCVTGYEGNPLVSCQRVTTPAPICQRDSDCSYDKACIKEDCRNPCEWYKPCAQYAECKVNTHRAVCTCIAGYEGNPLVSCQRVTTPAPICIRDSDCSYDKACIKEDCRNPCNWYTPCALNAECKVNSHRAVCTCIAGYEGNPLVSCQRVTTPAPICQRDSDCPYDKACIKEDCRNPCDWYKPCAQYAECKVNSHRAVCTCISSYEGNPLVSCRKVTTPAPICQRDSDCSYDKACIQEDCRNPCSWYKPCTQYAECKVTTHRAVCTCLPGYEGNPLVSCQRVTTPAPICQRDSDCPYDKACIQEDCRNPCSWYKPCAQYAECKVTTHRAVCTCLLGYEGNPLVSCQRVTTPAPICQRDSDCPYDKACIQEDCRNPCSWYKPCAQYAECKVSTHRAVCTCLSSYEGNPLVSCQKVTTPAPICTRDSDCSYDKACIKEDCHNPCDWYHPCGQNAICKVNSHRAICSCLPDYEGNPLVSCIKVTSPPPICIADSDCPFDKACIKEDCRNPCDWYSPCGQYAQCKVDSHRAVCSCLLGYEGNPLTECNKVTPRPPICDRDESCPFDKACIKDDCRNPCDWYKPCAANADCKAIHHKAVCNCIAGYEGNPVFGCTRVQPITPRPVCERDSDCPYDAACIQQDCHNPCQWYKPCGQNAECKVNSHRAMCTCPTGYEGNPLVICLTVPPPPVCLRDSDCPYDKACITDDCRNPCEWYKPCGQNAECKVNTHRAVCSCLPEFEGNPLVQCVPVTTPKPVCTRDSDCPHDKACIKDDCRNPCDWFKPCGQNTQCKVMTHRAVCTCLANYEGNPLTSCTQVTTPSPICVRDSDCSYDKACIQEDCRNPCTWYKPCGQNAQCRVDSHKPLCSCLTGFEGNPLVQCFKVTLPPTVPTPPPPICSKDSDCPFDKACIKDDCRDPCLWFKPCGPNAKCQPLSHRAMCTCIAGYEGNPATGCFEVTTPQPICRRDNDCSYDKACIQDDCRNPCTFHKPCGTNALCQATMHLANCHCPAGYEGNPLVACTEVTTKRPICVRDSDCSHDKACIKDDCRNPCDWYKPCGHNAECKVNTHRATCSCLPNFEGNPLISCYPVTTAAPTPPPPVCTRDSDCPFDKGCIKDDCRDPCDWYKPCGQNAQCKAVSHKPVCNCLIGYEGNAYLSCWKVSTVPPPICVRDSDCSYDKACIKDDCRNPCIWYKPCGLNAECKVNTHRAICTCLHTYEGNPLVACHPVTTKKPAICERDSDCAYDKACIQDDCRNPCEWYKPCGQNALCKATMHQATCHCPANYEGNPLVACRQIPATPKPVCVRDSDCPADKACIKADCHNPCQWYKPCGVNTDCRVNVHRAVCICQQGFEGNPLVRCSPAVPPTPEPGCRSNGDCPVQLACIQRECQNPCLQSPCGTKALCRVVIHEALCYCPPEFTGNPHFSCVPAGCQNNNECPSDRICRDRQCVDPCTYGPFPCGSNAICKPLNHAAMCACRPDYTGDPRINCHTVIIIAPQCRRDSDCPHDRACISGTCRNPCTEVPKDPCGANAFCNVRSHRPICSCPQNYIGNPLVRCIKSGCERDAECPMHLACIDRQCQNPCLIFSASCGRNAECFVDAHQARCRCPAGLRGNPHIECQFIECIRDEECPVGKACMQDKCQNPCSFSNRCAPSAQCIVPLHSATCICPEGMTGDPYKQCNLRKIDECYTDADCPSGLACIQEKCQNPCTLLSPCGNKAECKVIDTVPWRTMICICPAGFISDAQRGCVEVPKKKPECTSDPECPLDKVCVTQRCRNPCSLSDICGGNARCQATNHRPSCSCLPGYIGDPFRECQPAGCQSNNDCAFDKTCHERECVDPCYLKNRCHPTAHCKSVNHEAQCYCPSGMKGDPMVGCISVECFTSQDCPADRGCFNNKCQDPCTLNNQCGKNALCEARNHLAVCSCSKHMQGNPLVECRSKAPPPQCVTDGDCPSQMACITEKCQNPCLVLHPCHDGAICKVIDTVPWRTLLCICPNGFVATVNRGCQKLAERKEDYICQSDAQCSYDMACVEGKCIEPCITRNPCAKNAQCLVHNHRPTCLCPTGYYGDPRGICIKLECQSDNDCADDKTCHNNQCVNPCLLENRCGQNAFCEPKRHRAACFCQPGFKGDPLSNCIRIECHTDNDCPAHRACIEQHCRNPCETYKCGYRALCSVNNHRPACTCPPGYTGNAAQECTIIVKVECITDADCPSTQACITEKCQNPCQILRPCHHTAECKVVDTVPWRTMLCICPSGYHATPDRGCAKIPIPGACKSDAECDRDKACINGICEDPCRRLNECGQNALCSVPNHRSVCSCPTKTIGNPHVECKSVECESDNECASDKACQAHHCVNICLYTNPCGVNAECKMANHQQECRCISGFSGDPMVECKYIECHGDTECPDDRTCFNDRCVDPCSIQPCPSREMICKPVNHQSECPCPPGFKNEQFACKRIDVEIYECTTDADCPSGLACLNRACQNPCVVLHPCGYLAECKVVDTVPWRTIMCICPEGFMGNQNRGCAEVPRPPPKPKVCQSDHECSRGLACLQEDCKDPCLTDKSCAELALCNVPVHRPVCSCPTGYYGDPLVKCEKIQCSLDEECPADKACRDYQCVDLCLVVYPCGTNAECKMIQHRQSCECVKGFHGDAYRFCKPYECQRHEECADNRACIDHKCINPCQQAKCGKNANCEPQNHAAVCKCPIGFTGDARIECKVEDTSCKTDADCPSGLACMDRVCQNPCLAVQPCGQFAECKVIDTVPWRSMVCVCPNGYVGDLQRGCVLISVEQGCKSDSECPDHQGCIRRQCQDLCPHSSCGINALCHASNHRAVCSCPSRFIGDPKIECITVECRSDSDCAFDKSCLDNKCADICLFQNPCGVNSQCRMDNHVAICYCPIGWQGDPRVQCKEIECTSHDDCADDRACFSGRCVDLCTTPGQNHCPPLAKCFVSGHAINCKCPEGYSGNPVVACSKDDVICVTDADCPSGLACINEFCDNPCTKLNPCGPGAECKVLDTIPWRSMICICPNGFMSANERGCIRIEVSVVTPRPGCLQDTECPADKACINAECQNVCFIGQPCGDNAICKPINHRAVCVCIDSYVGKPEVGCVHGSCSSDLFCPDSSQCVGQICQDVCASNPCHVNADCHGVGHTVQCICKPGYEGDGHTSCIAIRCRTDDECADNEACIIGRCRNPCETHQCGLNAQCFPQHHQAVCMCVPPMYGDPRTGCIAKVIINETCMDHSCPEGMACLDTSCIDPCRESNPCGRFAECKVVDSRPLVTIICICEPGFIGDASVECRPASPLVPKTSVPYTEYPPTGSVAVNCRGDGIHVDVPIKQSFDGVVYVKGFSKDESCRRVMSSLQPPGTLPFVIRFNTCGLIPVGEIASFILVIQKHPKLVTHKARAYDVKCMYHIGEIPVTLSLNVSMITTSGTIANTGPPPTCIMRICNANGEDISTAEIGEILMLKLEVTPKSVYGGFARSCYALPMEDGKESYPVTDENGCALDPSVFGEWQYDNEKQVLVATFNAFKFPNGNTIRFQCDVKVCFGQCQPVNCQGVDAYGRKKRQARKGIEKDVGDDPSLANRDTADEYTKIVMNSNAIQIVDKQDAQIRHNHTSSEQLRRQDEVCVSTTGLIIALVITALLALVAIAVAVSCWLMAYRRRPKAEGPLPHPSDFPNPLYTTPEPIMEPSPDYMS